MKQAFGVNIPQTLEDVCDRARLALLVYDMQVGIVGQLRGAEAVTARVARVLETARQSGVRVFFTRHMSLPRELMGAFQYRMAMAWQRVDDPARVEPWFLRDSPGFAIVPELTPRPSEAILPTRRRSRELWRNTPHRHERCLDAAGGTRSRADRRLYRPRKRARRRSDRPTNPRQDDGSRRLSLPRADGASREHPRACRSLHPFHCRLPGWRRPRRDLGCVSQRSPLARFFLMRAERR